MLSQWLLFAMLTVVAYIGISIFSHLSGGQAMSAWQALLSAFRPIPLMVIVGANAIFAVGFYNGLTISRYALPVMLSIGVLTTFAYSLIFFGAHLSIPKVLGLALVLCGIVLLGL